MAYPTGIEWADATWNPIGGCSIASPGCIGCYAQDLAGTRLAHLPLYAGTTDTVKGKPVFNGKLTSLPRNHQTWRWPLRWRGAKAPKMGAGMPSMIFVGDMADLFHEDRRGVGGDGTFFNKPDIDEVLDVVWRCREHIFQLLTKRPRVMREYLAGWEVAGSPVPAYSNAWLGISAERQQEFDARWPDLAAIPATVRFVSYEPMLGPLDLGDARPDWVIAGCESGKDARPYDIAWVRSIRDQCEAKGIPFFLKQLSIGGRIMSLPELDGRQWREYPAPAGAAEEAEVT
jgi:protein gp37